MDTSGPGLSSTLPPSSSPSSSLFISTLLPDDFNVPSPLEAEYRTLAVAITSTYTTPTDAERATEEFIAKLLPSASSSSLSFTLGNGHGSSKSSYFSSTLVPKFEPVPPTTNSTDTTQTPECHDDTTLTSLAQPIVVLDTLVRLVLQHLSLLGNSSPLLSSPSTPPPSPTRHPSYLPINSNNIYDTCTLSSFLPSGSTYDETANGSSPSRTTGTNVPSSSLADTNSLRSLYHRFESLITLLTRLNYDELNHVRFLRRGLYTIYYLTYKMLYDQYLTMYTKVSESSTVDNPHDDAVTLWTLLPTILRILYSLNQSLTYWNKIPKKNASSVLDTLFTNSSSDYNTMNHPDPSSTSFTSLTTLFSQYQATSIGIFHVMNSPVTLFYDMYQSIYRISTKCAPSIVSEKLTNSEPSSSSSVLSLLLVTNLYSFGAVLNTSIQVHGYHLLSCYRHHRPNNSIHSTTDNDIDNLYLPVSLIEKCMNLLSTSNSSVKSGYSLASTAGSLVSSLTTPLKRSSSSRYTANDTIITSPLASSPPPTPTTLLSPSKSTHNKNNRLSTSIVNPKILQWVSKTLPSLQAIVSNYVNIESTISSKLVRYTLSFVTGNDNKDTFSSTPEHRISNNHHGNAFRWYLRSLTALRDTVQEHFHYAPSQTSDKDSITNDNPSVTAFFIDTPLKLSTIIKDIGIILNAQLGESTKKNPRCEASGGKNSSEYVPFLLRTLSVYLLNDYGNAKPSLQAIFSVSVDKHIPSLLSYLLTLLTDTSITLPLSLVKDSLLVLFALTTNRIENLTWLTKSEEWSRLGVSIGNRIIRTESSTNISEVSSLLNLFTYLSFGTDYPTYEWLEIFLQTVRSLCNHYQQTNTVMDKQTWKSIYVQVYAFAQYLSLPNLPTQNDESNEILFLSPTHRQITVSTRLPTVTYGIMEVLISVSAVGSNERYQKYGTEFSIENELLRIFRLLLPCSWSINHTNGLIRILKKALNMKPTVSSCSVIHTGWKILEILGEYGYVQSQVSFPLVLLPSLSSSLILPYLHRSLPSTKDLPIYTGRCPDTAWYFSPYFPSSLTMYTKTLDNECNRGLPVWPTAPSTSTTPKGYTFGLWLMILPSFNTLASVNLLTVSDSGRSLTVTLLPALSSSMTKSKAVMSVADTVSFDYTIQIRFTYQKHSPMVITSVHKLRTNQWYNLVLHHQAPTITTSTRLMKGLAKLGLSMAEVEVTPCGLFINGAEDTEMLVRYPNFGKNITVTNSTPPEAHVQNPSASIVYAIDITLGTHNDTSTSSSKPLRVSSSSPFFTGCVASFQLWDIPLQSSQIQGLYHLGPNYRGLFEPLGLSRHAINQVLQYGNRQFRTKETQKDAQIAIETLLNGKIQHHLLFCIYPSNTGGCILPKQSKRTLKHYFISTAPAAALRSVFAPQDDDSGTGSSTESLVASTNESSLMLHGVGLMSNVSVPCIVDVPLIDILQQTLSFDTLANFVQTWYAMDAPKHLTIPQSAMIPLLLNNLPLHRKDPLWKILVQNNDYFKNLSNRTTELPSSSTLYSALISTMVTDTIDTAVPVRLLCWLLDLPYIHDLLAPLPTVPTLTNLSSWLEESIFRIMRLLYPTVPFLSSSTVADRHQQWLLLFTNNYPAQPKLTFLHHDVVRNIVMNYSVWLRPGIADTSLVTMVLIVFLYCTIHQECLQYVRDTIGLPHLLQFISSVTSLHASTLVIDTFFALVRLIISSNLPFALPQLSFRTNSVTIGNSLAVNARPSLPSSSIALSKREVWAIFYLYAKESFHHLLSSTGASNPSSSSVYLLETILNLLQQIMDESRVASIGIVYCMLPDAYGEYVRTFETESQTNSESLPAYGGAELLLATTLSNNTTVSTLATNLLNQWMVIASQENITLFTDTSTTSSSTKTTDSTNHGKDDEEQKHLHAFMRHAAAVARHEFDHASLAVALRTETNETLLLEQHLSLTNEVYSAIKSEQEKVSTLTYEEGRYYEPPPIDKEGIRKLHSGNGSNDSTDPDTLVYVPPSTYVPLRAIQHIPYFNTYGYTSDIRTILPQPSEIYPSDALNAWYELRTRLIQHGAFEASLPLQPPRHWLSSYWMLLGTAQRQNLLPNKNHRATEHETKIPDNDHAAVENLSTKLIHSIVTNDNDTVIRTTEDSTPVKDANTMIRQLFSPADAKLLRTVSTIPSESRNVDNDDFLGGNGSIDDTHTHDRFLLLSSSDQSMDISILTDGASLESHSVNTTVDDTSVYTKEVSDLAVPGSLSTPVKNEAIAFSPSHPSQGLQTPSKDDTEPLRKFSLHGSPVLSRIQGTLSPLNDQSSSVSNRDSLSSSTTPPSLSLSAVSTTLLLSLPCKCIMPFQSQTGTLHIYRDRLTFLPTPPDTTDTKPTAPTPLPFSPTLYTPRVSAADTARKEYLQHLLPPIISWIIPIDTLVSIELRRHQHQPVALELFATTTSSYAATDLVPDASSLSSIILGFGSTVAKFLSFETTEDKDLCIRTVQRLRPLYLSPILRRPRVAAREMAQRWRLRKLSNFDYLITLNRIAGRTFNDIAQYPIFPWILADYTSETLDLQNPQSYRDFAYPIAAQSNERRKGLRMKYEFLVEQYMEEQNIDAQNPMTPQSKEAILSPSSALISDQTIFFGPPFHFGSCIMKGATVAWYLMRNEPFTTYHLICGDGRYDKPDRLFHSIADAYRSATNSDADIKELIPQFFIDGSFLRNHGHAILGWRQDYLPIDDVLLPPWAKDSNDFIRIHRLALESEYVSNHLHLWIDLVFGHKQRPESASAELAVNTFHRLMYPGYIDIMKVKAADENLYRRVCLFLDEFGVLPPILFPYTEIRTVNRTNRGYQVVNNYQRSSLLKYGNNLNGTGGRSGSFALPNDHTSHSTVPLSQRSISIVSRSTGSRGSGTLDDEPTSNNRSLSTDLTIQTKKLSTNSLETEIDHPGSDLNPSNPPRCPFPVILETLTVWPLFSRYTPHCSSCIAWSGISTCMDHSKVYYLLAWPQVRQSSLAQTNEDDNQSMNDNASNVGSYHMRPVGKGTGTVFDSASLPRIKKERSVLTTNRESSSTALVLASSANENPTLRSALLPLPVHTGAVILMHPIPGTDTILTIDTGRETGFHQWESLVSNKLNYNYSTSNGGTSMLDIPHFRWRLELDTRLTIVNETLRKIRENSLSPNGRKIAITGTTGSNNFVRNAPTFTNTTGLDTITLIYRNPHMQSSFVNPFLTPAYRYTSGTEYWSQAPYNIWSTSIIACSNTAPLLMSIGYSDNSLRLYAYGDLPVNMLRQNGKLDRCTVPSTTEYGSLSVSQASSTVSSTSDKSVIQWKDNSIGKGTTNNNNAKVASSSGTVPTNAANRRLQLLTIYGQSSIMIPTAVTCIDRMHPAVAARSIGLFSAVDGTNNTSSISNANTPFSSSSSSSSGTGSVNVSSLNPSLSFTNTITWHEHYPTTVPLFSPIFAVGYINGYIQFYGIDTQSSSVPQLQTSTLLRTIPDAHRNAVTCLFAQPALDTLLSASMDGTIGVWSLTTGVLKLRIHPSPYNESIAWITGTVLHPSIIAYFPTSNRIMHFSLFTGQALSKQSLLLSSYNLATVYCYCLSEDGNTLLVGGTGPYILIIHTSSLTIRGRIGLNGTRLTEAASIVSKPPPRTHDGTKEKKETDTMDQDFTEDPSLKLEPFTSAVTSLKLTAHENSLWVGCASGEVRIFVGGW